MTAGSTFPIRWNSNISSKEGFVRITLSDVNHQKLSNDFIIITNNTGLYNWIIPNQVPAGQYTIAIHGWDTTGSIDHSDSTFKILAGERENLSWVGVEFKVLNPSTEQSWIAGNTYRVNWFTSEKITRLTKMNVSLVDTTDKKSVAVDYNNIPYVFYKTTNEFKRLDIKIPNNIKPGKYYVRVAMDARGINNNAYSVLPITISDSKITPPVLSPASPYIDTISPSSARIGDQVTIYGRNFNNAEDQISISNGSGGDLVVTSTFKSDTSIRFGTPTTTPNVTYLLTILSKDGKDVAPVEFTILPKVQTNNPAPVVSTTSITYSLASVTVGETVTIYGQGFENVDQSRVLLSKGSGETTVTFISSTPNKIVFKVPSVPAGQYKLSVIGDRSTATTDLFIKLTAAAQEPPKPVTAPGGSQTSSVTITTNTPTSNLGNVVFDSVGPTDGVYYKWNIFDSNGVTVGTVQNGYVISRLYYNFTSPGNYSVNLSVVNKSSGNVVKSNTLQVKIVDPNQTFKPQTINPVPPPATPITPTTASQASGVPVSITSYQNKTTFTVGNVIFDSVGPTDGVYYKWNITNSSGVTTSQQNGEVIGKMYWNFTTPGTYKVNLSILQKGTDNLVGTSNTITVNITSDQNGASVLTIFDWFINLFR